MPELTELVTEAVVRGGDGEAAEDRTSKRILDAAVLEAAAVGVQRFTVEDVVRRAGVGRMTAYRRFPRRDDMVRAMVMRETQRFLATVAAGIDAAPSDREGVAEAFIAAVRFARDHPLLRRVAQADAGAFTEGLAAEDSALLKTGAAFIARQIHGDRPGAPSRPARWVADVFARLFLSYITIPPADPALDDDTQLRRFAEEVLTPMAERVAPPELA
jgi:AcrR family transcriptional regulator